VPIALAIDLGGTKVEAALVRDDGTIVAGTRARAATGRHASVRDLDAAVAEVVARCRDSEMWREVVAAGIGSAGPLDIQAGTASPVNLPRAAGLPLVDIVRRHSRLDRVEMRLDGTCIALAELSWGAARGARNAIVIVVSTGVGGGIVSDGRLIAGHSGNAGHIGQIVIQDDTRDDGTVEGIASGPRTVAWARRQGWTGDTGEQLAASYAAADPLAVAAVTRSANAVGVGLVNAATFLDLELAVIGGGFSFVAEDYPALVASAVRTHAIHDYAARLAVVRAELGGDAPLVGAAALAHRPGLVSWSG
jgi:glucokinase